MRDEWLEQRIAMTKKYGLAALMGIALIVELGVIQTKCMKKRSSALHSLLSGVPDL
jgi:hypothetical protein